MDKMIIKPQIQLKSMWVLGWTIQFILYSLMLLAFVLFLEYDANLVLGIIMGCLLFIMLLILLWIPAFYRSLEYSIDSDSISGKKGVFWRRTVTIPYYKITNIDITQGPVQRWFNIGTIHCQTAGMAGPQGQKAELKLLGIKDLEDVKEMIRVNVKEFVKSK
ncbi:MAG: PH domain-containing protein [Candidatus Aminicenantes bacterium]|nr:PH domain-containing protein [Candidatus Aminicenantes bacterium]